MKTILVSGKSGSGKDMFASFLKRELEANGQRVIITHYGDPVKFFATQYFGWDGVKDEKGRHLLQTLGTDWVRAVFPNYWAGIIAGFLDAMEANNQFDVAIVADTRFPNEIEVPCDVLEDVVVVRINRMNPDGSTWLNPALTDEQHRHPSETSLDDYICDYTIINDDGLDILRESAHTFLIDTGLIEGEM